jgi:hypothetical protein
MTEVMTWLYFSNSATLPFRRPDIAYTVSYTTAKKIDSVTLQKLYTFRAFLVSRWFAHPRGNGLHA